MNSFFHRGWLRVLAGLAACCCFAGLAWGQSAAQVRASAPVSAGYEQGKNSRGPSDDQIADAEQSYVSGARSLSDGKFELAQKHFERAAKLNPNRSEYAVAVQVAKEHRVTALVQAAAQANRKGKKAQADALLAEAAKVDPDSEMVKQHMPTGAKAKTSVAEVLDAANRDAATKLLVTFSEKANGAGAPDGPVELKLDGQRHSFHLHEGERQLIPQVLQAYGIKTIVDDSVSGQTVRLDVENVTAAEVIPVLDELTHTFVVPVEEHMARVGADTTEVHDRLDRQMYETIYLPGMSEDEMKSAMSVAREVFGVRQSALQAGHQTMTVRAPEETLKALNTTLGTLLDNDSEVMLDVSLYEMDYTNTRQTGITPPQTVSAFNFDSEIQQVVSANQSTINQAISSGLITQGNYLQYAELLLAAGLLQNTVFGQSFALFGGGLTRTGVNGVGSTLTMALNSSDARMLDETNILAQNKQAGTFREGERYPIATSQFSNLAATGTSSASLSGLSASELALLGLSGTAGLSTNTTSVIPQIQYEDLGLTLKTTPVIQRNGQVTLHFDLKLESLSGQTVDDIPVLNNRAFSGDVVVQDGQNAVLTTNLTKQETGAISGTPGISEIPGFDDIASRETSGSGQKLVMVVRPHLVREVKNIYAGPMVMLSLHPETFRDAPALPVALIPNPGGPIAPGVVPVQPNGSQPAASGLVPNGFGANGLPNGNAPTGNGFNP